MTITTIPRYDLSTTQAELVQKAIAYEKASLSANTLRSYASMWKKYETWCSENNLSALPSSSETVALYLTSIGESSSFSTLDSTIAAIEAVHEKASKSINGDPSLYRRIRKGIRRTHKENQTVRQAKPITLLDLKMTCHKMDDSLAGKRDKALLTLTFFGALRRSEAVGLDVGHLEFGEKGVAVSLMSTKTSDTRQRVHIAKARDASICPVKALQEWISASCITEGPLFRSLVKGGSVSLGRLSGYSVSTIIKKHFGEDYSGHSARRGTATEAAEKGVSIHTLKRIGRWKGADMALRYAETATAYEDSAVAVLGA